MAQTKTKKSKKVLVIAGVIILAVGGYFGYKYIKGKKDKKKAEEEAKRQEEQAKIDAQNVSTGSGSGSGSAGSGSATYSANPFKSATELTNFQKWVLEKKKDTTILGNAGADGKWGKNSASAWNKYGKEYLGSGSTAGESGSVPEADIKTIVNYGRGAKSDRTYIAKTKYPSFFTEWAKAIRKRLESGGKAYTTFIWYNQIYDSYYGNQVASKLLMGKIAFARNGCKIRKSPKQSGEYILTTKDASLGQIVSWRYNVAENLLYVKTDKYSDGYGWAKYQYIYTN